MGKGFFHTRKVLFHKKKMKKMLCLKHTKFESSSLLFKKSFFHTKLILTKFMWKNHFDALKHVINYQFLCGKTFICVKTHNLLNKISHIHLNIY